MHLEAETVFTRPVRPGTAPTIAPTIGCAASTDTARSIGTRAVSPDPIAAQGEERMTRTELAARIAAETSVTKAAAERMVAAIADALARDEAVAIAGFGKFETRRRAARAGRNPGTGETVAIPASKAPSFKAAKALRDTVNR